MRCLVTNCEVLELVSIRYGAHGNGIDGKANWYFCSAHESLDV
jgi:hypothetical protein